MSDRRRSDLEGLQFTDQTLGHVLRDSHRFAVPLGRIQLGHGPRVNGLPLLVILVKEHVKVPALRTVHAHQHKAVLSDHAVGVADGLFILLADDFFSGFGHQLLGPVNRVVNALLHMLNIDSPRLKARQHKAQTHNQRTPAYSLLIRHGHHLIDAFAFNFSR